MSALRAFRQALTKSEARIVKSLATPGKIQAFLEGLAYTPDDEHRCPLRVLRKRIADCSDGALFAAAMLHCLGHRPLVVPLLTIETDDNHLFAVYRRGKHWGAVAKSNFAGLRFREPVYRSLRELVMSYFEQYYSLYREKSLRYYTRPLDLGAFDKAEWMTSDETLEAIDERLSRGRRIPLLARQMIAGLSPVDERSYRSGTVGTDQTALIWHEPKRGRKKSRT